ncbi:MAG: uracil phosphoribosyltransferase [Lysobacteraceae bacterium]
MNATEVRHPLVQHKLARLRDAQLDSVHFRQFAGEIAACLAYEAMADIPTEDIIVHGWAGDVACKHVRGRDVTLVPILRAGLGLLPGVQTLLPSAPISVVGFKRNEDTLEAEGYYENLAPGIDDRRALILDPMLATGGTLIATVDLLKAAGCGDIRMLCLVAAPEGLKRLADTHPDVHVFAAAIDERLNKHGYILPGLGDAGDRLFGTPQM